MKRFRSLRSRLLRVMMLTTLVAVAVAVLSTMVNELRSYHRAALEDMESQAALLAQSIAPALSFDDAAVARETLALMKLRAQIESAAAYRSNGEQFAQYRRAAGHKAAPTRVPAEGVEIADGAITVVREVRDGGDLVGAVYVRAKYGLAERLQEYAMIAASITLLAMLVAFAVSSWMQRIITRPILAISDAARAVVLERDFSKRAPKLTNDEVGALADSFNNMLQEIEQRVAENEAAARATQREIAERQIAQDEVMRLNAGLEERVRLRTQQLEASNRDLHEATEAAEAANRAKSEFLSSMSHELRTPLNAILGFGQLLSIDDGSMAQAKRSEFSSHILKAGNHLLTLINEVLDLARIEASNLMLSPEPVALADVLRDCQTMSDEAARRRGIRMLFPPTCHLAVHADRTRLKQVVLNLLSNAVKYNRDSGAVVVECESTGQGRVRLRVRDTGLGLRPDQLAQLFQPFNRLGQEAGTEEGTGIGLVVTRRLVELMGGSIGAESTPGSGSVFWIELLEAELANVAGPNAGEAVRPASVREAGATASPTLLYIEDNPANLRLVEEIVHARGDLVTLAAPDAQLGIELARAHLPAVVLMDINLPGLAGTDALALLRHDDRTARIPIIAVTANAMPRDIARGLAAGFFRYVTKPINVGVLNEAIDAALVANLPGQVDEGG